MEDFRADADDATVVRGSLLLWPRAEEPTFVTPLYVEREEPLLPLVPDCERAGHDYLRSGHVVA